MELLAWYSVVVLIISIIYIITEDDLGGTGRILSLGFISPILIYIILTMLH